MGSNSGQVGDSLPAEPSHQLSHGILKEGVILPPVRLSVDLKMNYQGLRPWDCLDRIWLITQVCPSGAAQFSDLPLVKC